jgi:outer membrane biosynthesis protein TonB
MTAFYWIGAALTAVLYPVLLAKRYPGQPRWVVVGVLLGLVAALLWPVTLWVALALWLTGFTRPTSGPRARRRVALPVATGGALATMVVMASLAGPLPTPTTPTAPAAFADVVMATTTAAPTTTVAPTTVPPTSTVPVVTTTPPTTAPPTTTTPPPTTARPQPVTTTTAAPAPKPRPEPKPKPKPKPKPDSGDSGSKPRTGNSGHLCGPGERDGDGDGYCGER